VRAVVFEEFGGPEVLKVQDVPRPGPGWGEVVVRVHAVGVERTLDLLTRAGLLPFAQHMPLPHILGAGHVGTVSVLGEQARNAGVGVGDRVAVFPVITCGRCGLCVTCQSEACPNLQVIGVHRPGAYADYTAVPVANVHRVPDDVSDLEACALALDGPLAARQLDLAGVRLVLGCWSTQPPERSGHWWQRWPSTAAPR
jgi:NADPH:quinone reductase-like Zn-dependent oxidoreductase